jgi:ZIP family zinc transporter
MKKQLMRAGLVTALAIWIHNIPEWLVTFLGALEDPYLWVALAVAIAIHNIPEWIAVAVPIYYATWSKWKWFLRSLLSGILEPVGAILWYLLLSQWIGDSLYGIMFWFVAGIMIFISFDELLPSAEKYGYHHVTIYWLLIGMLVMWISLGLFL